MATIKFEGLDKLRNALKRKSQDLEPIKRVVSANGAMLTSNMQRKAIFTKGYSHGDTQRSIRQEIVDNGLTVKVKPHTDYSPYLEYGTRFMAAQPFVHPAWNEQKVKFKSDLEKVMK